MAEVTPTGKHIVALSGGWDSTALALRLAEVEPRDYEYICTPTGAELPEMQVHWDRLESLLGRPLNRLTTGRTLQGLVVIQKALPNWRMRWCTRMLKIEPFEGHIIQNMPCVVHVGIRADEVEEREGVAWETFLGVERRYDLVRWGWGIPEVVGYCRQRGAEPPPRTDCDCCFFQTIYEWYMFWLRYPEIWAQRESLEELTGHTFRSPGRDTWPAAMKELRKLFEAGVIPKKRQTMKDRKVMCSTCAR